MRFSSDRFLFTVDRQAIGFSLAEWAAELKFLPLANIIMQFCSDRTLHQVIHDYTGLLRR